MIHRYGVETEHLDDDVNHVPGVMPGNMMEELQRLAADREIIVEIGSYKGKSACALASTCPGIVYCIDPWDGNFPVGVPESLSVYREFLAYTAHHGFLGNNIVPLTMTSGKAAPYFADKSIDMVFIDGDHAFNAVVRDLTLWAGHKLKDTGLVCGDDYGSPSVSKAVDGFASRFGWSVHLKHDKKMWFLTRPEA
jgi:predicted O-methyltransferase YrrM